jgi:hypothetical protein
VHKLGLEILPTVLVRSRGGAMPKKVAAKKLSKKNAAKTLSKILINR